MIPLNRGSINVIANVHTALTSAALCEGEKMVVSIMPPDLIAGYGIKRILWLTYFPGDYSPSYSPDRLEFEVMDQIIEFVRGGGKCVVLQGVEYLSLIHGKDKVYEFIRRIDSLDDELTVIVAVNGNLDEWAPLSVYRYECRRSVRNLRVFLTEKYEPDRDTLVISVRGKDGGIGIQDYGDPENFLFRGLEAILKSNMKNVYIECLDYLIATTPEKALTLFMKDLIDVVITRGGYVAAFSEGGRVYTHTLLSLFESTGLERTEIFEDREREIREVLDAVLTPKKRNFVLVSGEVGVGKTSLISRIKNYLVVRGYKFFEVRCYYETTEPYLPIREAFGVLFENLKLQYFAPTDRRNLDAQRNAFFYDFARELRKAFRKDRVVVFFDDMHWMDASSLKLLHYLAANLQDLPITFIGAYRSEEVHGDLREFISRLRREGLTEEIVLSGLRKEHVALMLSELLGSKPPNRFVDVIYEKSGGNPLFVKEIVYRLLDAGQIVPDKGIYPETLEFDIPTLISDVVNRRLRLLGDGGRKVMEISAVYGYRVDPEVVIAVSGMDEMNALDLLDRAVELGLLKTDRHEESYLFREGIIRDSIYNGISRIKRRLLHRRIAEEILRLRGEDRRYYALLAHHFGMAGLHERAAEYYVKAAEEAERVYAHENAIELYRKALDLEIGREMKFEIMRKMAKIYGIIGMYDMAFTYYLEAMKLTDDHSQIAEVKLSIGDLYTQIGKYEHALKYYEEVLANLDRYPHLSPRVYNAMAWVSLNTGKYEDAINYSKKAIELAGELSREAGMAYHILGTVFIETERTEYALEYLGKAIEIRKKIGDLDGLSKSYNNLGIVYQNMGDDERALEYYQRSLETMKKINNLRGISTAYNNIGTTLFDRANLEGALEYYRKSMEIKERIGDREGISIILSNMGDVHLYMADFERALKCYRRALEIAEKTGNKWIIAMVHIRIGRAYLEMGNYEDALAHATNALRISEDASITRLECDSLVIMSLIHAHLGNLDDALNLAEKALALAEQLQYREYIMDARRTLGIVYLMKGEYDKAKENLEEAFSICKSMDYAIDYIATLYEYGRLLIEMGDQRGYDLIREAREMAEKGKIKLYLPRIEEILKGHQ